jgi:hypothetical protein
MSMGGPGSSEVPGKSVLLWLSAVDESYLLTKNAFKIAR